MATLWIDNTMFKLITVQLSFPDENSVSFWRKPSEDEEHVGLYHASPERLARIKCLLEQGGFSPMQDDQNTFVRTSLRPRVI